MSGLVSPALFFPFAFVVGQPKSGWQFAVCHLSKKKEKWLGCRNARLLDDGIKVEMVCHDQQSGFLRTTGNFQWHRMRQKHDAVPLFVLVVV